MSEVGLFLGFFPQSLAGPIHRINDLLPQFRRYSGFSSENFIVGIKTCIFGYFLKLIIADKINLLTESIFNDIESYSSTTLFISSLLFSFEIYFDFWGYSLIAIGIGRILGFRININFNNPYSVTSFRKFWHRWHITLSKWLKDYIYLSLGGRHHKKYILFALSIFITFLVSSLWHGIYLNFILWGTVHAILYLVEDLFLKKKSILKGSYKLPKTFSRLINHIIFITIISLTWAIFKLQNIESLVLFFQRIFNPHYWSVQDTISYFSSFVRLIYLSFIIGALLICHRKSLSILIGRKPGNIKEILWDSVYYFITISTITIFGDIGGQEFLYSTY
jgi:D-alanyl-lipoteichoic acid acyltransferase DltB (MBOAT superfamily)